MALFPSDSVEPAPRRRRGRIVGTTLIVVAVVGTLAFSQIPAPYVIEQPGPVFNTIGSTDVVGGGNSNGTSVPLIEIPHEKTYPTAGSLDMLTVNLLGDPENSPSWIEVAQAWLDRSKAVLPMDAVYPPGTTVEQSNEESATEMTDSQQDAVAAALTELGYTVPTALRVGAVEPKSAASGILKVNDIIESVNGTPVKSATALRSLVKKSGAGVALRLEISRKGTSSTVTVTPELSEGANPVPLIGIVPAASYSFPIKVTINLKDVGGPSAGQMLALGIIDKLTPGKLNGGARVAGTGTIDAQGTVGVIGGIRQKMYGARAAGATWFLAPSGNCNEVTGHIPSGLTVFAVKTLDDSLAALKAIKSGSGTSGLPTCTTK